MSGDRLSAANAELQVEVQAQLAELRASRRRLLRADDEERERLETRLRDGPERRLRVLENTLWLASDRDNGLTGPHLERAEHHLTCALDDLHELARGLHPRELSAGLGPALAALAERITVPVELTVIQGRFDAEIEVTAYFVCAEALVNVAKHAACSRVAVEVSRRPGQLVVVIADDGPGGAEPANGSGLRGLADRVETLGGTLRVESPSGGGTRLTAELRLDRKPSLP